VRPGFPKGQSKLGQLHRTGSVRPRAFHETVCPQTECSCFQAARSMWPIGRCELQQCSVGDPHVEKIFVWRRLTPELSRTAARNGGVVHVTMQPSREAVSA